MDILMEDFANNLDQAIEKGIDYLHQHQYPNGEFCSYISADDPMEKWTVPDSTVFPAALIGSSLIFLQGHPKVEEMLNKTIPFLRYQMNRGGVWNHFTHLHRLRYLCPLDVDDTATVCALFKERNERVPNNLQLLLDNRNKDKLFYSWFIFRLKWNPNPMYWRLVARELLNPVTSFVFWKKMECGRDDIDGVVNANLMYYLGDTEYTQPIIQLLIKIIEEKKEGDCDKWYRNPFTVYYFMSRNYYIGITKLEAIKQPIIDRILATSRPDGRLGGSILDTALAVSTLLNFRYNCAQLENAARFLISTQRATGEWERWLLYYGGPKLLQGWGSEEITTGFCLEALARYRKEMEAIKID
jgi:hypothetical protein